MMNCVNSMVKTHSLVREKYEMNIVNDKISDIYEELAGKAGK